MGHANLGGGPRHQGLGRGFALHTGRHRRGYQPIHIGLGISGVGTWISYKLFIVLKFWESDSFNKMDDFSINEIEVGLLNGKH